MSERDIGEMSLMGMCEDLKRRVGLKMGMEDTWCMGNGYEGYVV